MVTIIKKENVKFRPKAEILIQLGDQLIKNEGIALLELIKNSYDADAKKCDVTLDNLNIEEKGTIIIEDDGSGMTFDVIKHVWMEPGNTHKRSDVLSGKRTPLGRLPIGEKGIGRFGIHKLGKSIEIVSKARNHKEVFFKLNWNEFENDVYLDQIPITIFEREPVHFTETTGTRIIIKDLSTEWNRGRFRNVYRAMTSLNSPFKSTESFNVNIRTNHKDWLENLLTFEAVKDYALFKLNATISDDMITDFEYVFSPFSNMKLSGRTEKIKNIKLKRIVDSRKKESEYFSLKNKNIGEIDIELYVFDRSSDVTRFINDKRSFGNYLNENGGIRVFRDNMRVLDYGEKGNDWLGFDIKRVNRPSVFLSNNLLLGAIYLDRESSSGLVEKANREGFIQNDSYNYFVDAIDSLLIEFNFLRNADKNKLRISSKNLKQNIDDYVKDISDSIQKLPIDEIKKKSLNKMLTRISDEFSYLKETYVRTSSATTSYAVVIHEMEKVLLELRKVSDNPNQIDKIDSLTKRLMELVGGYTDILRNRKQKLNTVTDIIENALFNVEFRLRAHNVEIIKAYIGKNDRVTCDAGMMISSIMNIIDNSIWWTHVAQPEVKKIYIDINKDIESKRVEIVIADNGTGFSGEPEDLIRPFVTSKPGGIGIGLNIVNEIMNSQGGQLLFPDYSDLEIRIPEEFQTGAIVSLSLPESEGV